MNLQNGTLDRRNFPFVAMFDQWGTEEQKAEFITGGFERTRRVRLRPSPNRTTDRDATHMETVAVREARDGVDGLADRRQKKMVDHRDARRHPLRDVRTHFGQGGGRQAVSPVSSSPTPRPASSFVEWIVDLSTGPTDHPRLSVTND